MVAVATREGYAGASVSRVIAHAGVSRPTFYEFFADKDDCFLATHREIARQLLTRIRRAVEQAPPERAVEAAIRGLIEHAEQEPARAQFLVSETMAGGPGALDEHDRMVAEMERVVDRARERAPAEASMPDVPARLVIGAAQLMLSARLRRDERELTELTEELVRSIEAYELPAGEHRWRTLAPGPPPPSSPFVSELPPNPPAPIPPGRSRLSREDLLRNQRRRILYATAEVAAGKGYTATTIADITGAASVDRRVFYAHFRDKQQAFLAVHELAFQQTMAVASGAFFSEATWPERIWQGILAVSQFHATFPTIAHIGFIESHAVGAAAMQRVDDNRQAFTIFLQEGNQQAGEPRSRTAMEVIAAAIFEIGYHQCRHGRARQLPRLAQHATYLALAPFLGPKAANDYLDGKLPRNGAR